MLTCRIILLFGTQKQRYANKDPHFHCIHLSFQSSSSQKDSNGSHGMTHVEINAFSYEITHTLQF